MSGKKRYHMRRKDKEIKRRPEILNLIMKQEFMTIAMCRDNEPYLITVDYSFDKKKNAFYFHCASSGKKNDFLSSNPRVWGTIIEDLGYVQGECEHSYRSVHFWGKVSKVKNVREKTRALELMIDKLDDDPEQCRKDAITKDAVEKVEIIRIDAEGFTGKQSIY